LWTVREYQKRISQFTATNAWPRGYTLARFNIILASQDESSEFVDKIRTITVKLSGREIFEGIIDPQDVSTSPQPGGTFNVSVQAKGAYFILNSATIYKGWVLRDIIPQTFTPTSLITDANQIDGSLINEAESSRWRIAQDDQDITIGERRFTKNFKLFLPTHELRSIEGSAFFRSGEGLKLECVDSQGNLVFKVNLVDTGNQIGGVSEPIRETFFTNHPAVTPEFSLIAGASEQPAVKNETATIGLYPNQGVFGIAANHAVLVPIAVTTNGFVVRAEVFFSADGLKNVDAAIYDTGGNFIAALDQSKIAIDSTGRLRFINTSSPGVSVTSGNTYFIVIRTELNSTLTIKGDTVLPPGHASGLVRTSDAAAGTFDGAWPGVIASTATTLYAYAAVQISQSVPGTREYDQNDIITTTNQEWTVRAKYNALHPAYNNERYTTQELIIDALIEGTSGRISADYDGVPALGDDTPSEFTVTADSKPELLLVFIKRQLNVSAGSAQKIYNWQVFGREGTSDNLPKLSVVERDLSTWAYEVELSGLPSAPRVRAGPIYNAVNVTFTDEEGVKRTLHYSQFADLRNDESIAKFGLREPTFATIDSGQTSEASALERGKIFVSYYSDPVGNSLFQIDAIVEDNVRSYDGDLVPVAAIRSGNAIRINGFRNPFASGQNYIIFWIVSVAYNHDRRQASLTSDVPPDILQMFSEPRIESGQILQRR
jgi:hypothetical protein